MKKTQFTKITAALLAMGVGTAATNAITVTQNADATQLANALLGGGITINSASYTGDPVAAGTFTGGAAAGLTIDTGILLTSGQATLAQGPNNASGAGLANSGGSYAPLGALIPGFSINDAAYLTINFTTTGGDLFFNYVFASEEYNEYANSAYNDVFGFFVDGTLVANNIALLPGTSTPVSINNVNGGNPLGTNPQNPAYFINNPVNPNLQYDGHTVVLTASALGLGAGNHTIILAIADSGDSILDSGVFIQGGSFSDTPLPPTGNVPDGGSTLALLGMGAVGLAGLRRKLSA